MKTRDEMVYDFMLAVASGMEIKDNLMFIEGNARFALDQAKLMADQYLKFMSGK